jgi:hypothetical protein
MFHGKDLYAEEENGAAKGSVQQLGQGWVALGQLEQGFVVQCEGLQAP